MIADAREIQTKRLRLRPFREEDYDDLYEFLAQLKNDEFEGYPGITYENGRKHLQERLDSTAYYAVELLDSGNNRQRLLRRSGIRREGSGLYHEPALLAKGVWSGSPVCSHPPRLL